MRIEPDVIQLVAEQKISLQGGLRRHEGEHVGDSVRYFDCTALIPNTLESSVPCPDAMSWSIRSATDGSAASGRFPAVSSIKRTSLRAIVSSKVGVKSPFAIFR